MKKKNYIIALLLVASINSCDYLDVVPDNVATIEYAFRNRVEAEKYLFTCYSYLPVVCKENDAPGRNTGDELWNCPYVLDGKRYYNLNRGQNLSDPYFNYWDGRQGGKDLYEALRNCNIFLENVENIKDLDTYERARWAAEVKFLKAYYHWYLAQLYGPIPIVKKNIPISASTGEMQVYRDPFDDVVNYVVELIDEAIVDLPAKIESNLSEDGRITASIAYGMKAKILVTAASPLFNGNADYTSFKDNRGVQLMNASYDKSKWERAREACREAIEFCDLDAGGEGGFSLYTVDDFIQAPKAMTPETKLLLTVNNIMTMRWNKELIWGETKNVMNQRNPLITINQTTFRTAGANSHHNPTLRTVENYYTKNGLPIGEDANWDYNNRYKITTVPEDHKPYAIVGDQTINLHLNREPRFYANVGFDRGLFYLNGVTDLEKDEMKQHQIKCRQEEPAGKNGIMNYSGTGYFAKKLIPYQSVVNTSGGWTQYNFPFPLFRLGDLYLLYAEAINECLENDNSPSDNLAIEYVDKIRRRAGLKGVKESWETYALPQFKNKYETKGGLREIIRQERMIELAFEGQVYFDKRRWKLMTTDMNEAIKGMNTEGYEAETFYMPITLFKPEFGMKDYLYPIREETVLANPNLVQNPGW